MTHGSLFLFVLGRRQRVCRLSGFCYGEGEGEWRKREGGEIEKEREEKGERQRYI